MWCADRDALYVATTACLLLPDAGEGAVHGGAIMKTPIPPTCCGKVPGLKKVRIVGVISMLLGRDEIFGLADSDELVVPDDDRHASPMTAAASSIPVPPSASASPRGTRPWWSCPPSRAKKWLPARCARQGAGIECNMDPKTGLRQVVWDAPSWCGPSGRILYYHVEMVTMDTCRSRRCAGTEVCLDKDVIAIKIRAADRDEILGASTLSWFLNIYW